jgi:hypothetical protein
MFMSKMINIMPVPIKQRYLQWRQARMMKVFRSHPEKLAVKNYKNVFGENPNLKNPKNLIEKIIWLQFNSDTSLWTLCADKFRVREYVKNRGQEDILCKLYGVWEDANQIDFDVLPEEFVLKTNNSCGQIIIVRNKADLNIKETRDKLRQWMSQGYGYSNAQMHYTRIEPCIIAEELLESESTSSLVDYKIWCFNGVPECILVCSERIPGQGVYSLSMYDTEWNNISEQALNTQSIHFRGTEIPKPDNFNAMLHYASKLSEGFPEVRVDLYNIYGRIVFGELTFTTGYGSYKKSFYEYLGSKVQIKQ